jgi:hypothetical protein
MAIKPIQRFGKFTPPRPDQSGEIRMRALAGLGTDISSLGRSYAQVKGQEVREQRAQEEVALREQQKLEGMTTGRKAAEIGEAPVLKLGGEIGSPQYNSTVIQSYNAGTRTKVDSIYADAEQLHPDNLDAFNEVVSAQLEGMRNAMPEWAQGSFDDYVAREQKVTSTRVSGKQQKIIDAKVKNDLLQGHNSLVDQATNLAFLGDEEGVEQAVAEGLADLDSASNLLTSEQIASRKENLLNGVAIYREKGVFQRLLDSNISDEDKIKQGQAIINRLTETPLSTLNAQQNETLRSSLTAQLNSFTTGYQKRASLVSAEQTQQISNLDLNVGLFESGQSTMTSVDLIDETERLWNGGKGPLTQAKYDEYRLKILQLDKTEQKKYEDRRLVASVIAGPSQEDIAAAQQAEIDIQTAESPEEEARLQAIIDKPSKRVVLTKEQVNDYYDSIEQNNLPVDPIQRAAQQASFIKSVRIVPTTIKNELQQGVFGNDKDAMIQASDLMTRLNGVAGLGESLFSTEMQVRIKRLNTLASYMDYDLAVQKVNVDTDPANVDRVNARRAEISGNPSKFENKYPDEVAGLFGWFDMSSNELQKSRMVKDYTTLVNEFYAGGAELEEAKEIATELMQNNWGESVFGVMKYKPEDYYGIGQYNSVNYMIDDLYNDLSGPFGMFGLEFKKEDIVLLSDSITAREATLRAPSYQMFIRTNAGLIPATVNGLRRYRPDVLSEKEKIAKQKEEEAKEFTRLQEQKIMQTVPAAL